MGLSQTYKDFRRLQQIANVLFKQELGYFVEKLDLKSQLPFSKRLMITKFSKPKESVPNRLRVVMEELGGSFVKLGQLLSLRPDLVPQEYLDEFTKLQDSVKPFPFEVAKIIIESELKNPLNKIFSYFNKEPIAAASVGQVYEAILKNGNKVAVKVQRPGIRQVFATDIDLMYHLARLLEKHMPESKSFNPVGIVEEFDKYTRKELDYISEGRNIEAYKEAVVYEKNVVIPKVYWDFTTSKVLTMEFMEGVKISSLKDFRRLGVKGSHLSNTLVRLFAKGVLYFHFFHADPHPGNILLMKGKKIALLDFGIMGRLSPELTEKIGMLYFALIKADVNMITDGLINIGMISNQINRDEFKADISDAWGKYYDTSLSQVNMSGFFWDSIRIGKKYEMKYPAEYVLLMKAMITTEGVIQKIDPHFNFVKAGKPIFQSYIKERTSTKYLLKGAKETLINFKDLFVRFPVDAQKILTKLESDDDKEFNVKIDADIKKFTLEMERSSNRMTLGFIMASFVVASTLIILAKIPPFVWGLPLYSLISLLIAGILLIIFTISAFKK